MITEWFYGAGADFFVWIVSLFPKFNEFDGVVVTVGTFLNPLLLGMASLGAWIPWPIITMCMSALFPLFIGAFLFRVLRVVAGHLPLIGGNG